jgi:hypothetical protein
MGGLATIRTASGCARMGTRPSRRRRSDRSSCSSVGCPVGTFALGSPMRTHDETDRADRIRTYWERWHLARHWRTDERMRAAQLGLDPRAKGISPLQRAQSTSAKELPVGLRIQIHSIARSNAMLPGALSPRRRRPSRRRRYDRRSRARSRCRRGRTHAWARAGDLD